MAAADACTAAGILDTSLPIIGVGFASPLTALIAKLYSPIKLLNPNSSDFVLVVVAAVLILATIAFTAAFSVAFAFTAGGADAAADADNAVAFAADPVVDAGIGADAGAGADADVVVIGAATAFPLLLTVKFTDFPSAPALFSGRHRTLAISLYYLPPKETRTGFL
jgi:hypothetical protein